MSAPSAVVIRAICPDWGIIDPTAIVVPSPPGPRGPACPGARRGEPPSDPLRRDHGTRFGALHGRMASHPGGAGAAP